MPRAGWFRVQELASGRAGGVVLILSGLAVAGYAMLSGTGDSAPQSALQAVIGSRPLVDQPRSQDEALPKRQTAFGAIVPPPARAAEAVPAFSAPVVVTIAQRPSEPPAAAPRTAAIPKDRDTLARELQKELRRVGCYEGELNGAWTPPTRRAMKAFTDRLNATLPVEEPDAVLLVMVQSQQDRVCGKPCPAGQGLSEDGRCLPNAILAKAAKRASPPVAVAHLPTANPAPPARRAPAVASWSATIAAAAPAPPPVVATAPAIVSVPAEGRMGLAGPTQEPNPALTSDPPSAAKPPVRSRAATHARRPRVEARFVSAPRRGIFARTVFRRIDSSL